MGMANTTAQLGLRHWLTDSIGREEIEQSLSEKNLTKLPVTGFLQIISYFSQLMHQHPISAPQSLFLQL